MTDKTYGTKKSPLDTVMLGVYFPLGEKNYFMNDEKDAISYVSKKIGIPKTKLRAEQIPGTFLVSVYRK